MVERYSMIGRDFGARMDVRSNGAWVRYCDLAAARAEIERLTKERDEARAQVAAAYEVVAIRSENYACGAPYNQRATINALANHLRGMTSADAQAALEAYGREKVEQALDAANAYMTIQYGIAALGHPVDRQSILDEMGKLK